MVLHGKFKPLVISNTAETESVDALINHLQQTGHIANVTEVVGPVVPTTQFVKL
jgi:hypothetical protein